MLASNTTVLTGDLASKAAILDAFQRFAAAVAEDRAADGKITYDALADLLDGAFPELARQRDAAAPDRGPVSVRLPSPAILAVLDTASAQVVAPGGAVSRCAHGPTTGPSEELPRQPRLRYHARQVAPQGYCYSWESAESGVLQGEITRWFAPYFAENHDRIEIFGQEIGPGASGVVAHAIRGANQAVIGTSVWTSVAPAAGAPPIAAATLNVSGVAAPEKRARWYMAAFPPTFTLEHLDQAPAGWQGQNLCLNAENVPFPAPTQAVERRSPRDARPACAMPAANLEHAPDQLSPCGTWPPGRTLRLLRQVLDTVCRTRSVGHGL